MSFIDIKNLKRFERLMSQYKLQIDNKMKMYGKHASRKTINSIQPYAFEENGVLNVGLKSDRPIVVKTLETGRKAGKVPMNFQEIIYQWSIDKGIYFENDDERWKFSNALKWKIIKSGTQQFRDGKNDDIYSSLEKFYEQQVIKGIKQITNNQVKKLMNIF